MVKTVNSDRRQVLRLLGDYPIEDAQDDLMLVILPDDLKRSWGKQKDPAHCVLACAAKRMFGDSETVYFFTTSAYITMPDEAGNMVIRRYTVPAGTKRVIVDYDHNKFTTSRVSVWLYAPSPARQMEYMRKRASKWHKEQKKKPKEVHFTAYTNNRKSKKKIATPADYDVRDGRGTPVRGQIIERVAKRRKHS